MLRDWKFLLLVILLGAALRLDLLIANNFVIDADEAIVGLMAKHIVEGQGIPTFYYGQHYMGSLEALCVSVLFLIFGDTSSSLLVKIVPFLFSLAFIYLVYRLAVVVAGKKAARISAILCAISPSALIVWSGMARGGFIEIVVIGAYSFVLLQRWLLRRDLALPLVAFIGLILGLGWWVNNQILYFMIPVALLMLGKIVWNRDRNLAERLKDLFKVGATGLTAWLIGGLPYWLYNLNNDWASLGMFEPTDSKNVGKYFQGFYETALPIILGGSRFWQRESFFPGSKEIVGLIYGGLLIAFIAFRWKQILRMFCLKFDRAGGQELFLILLISCGAIFVFSSFGWLAQAPRYLLPMYVGIFVMTGFVIAKILEGSKIIGYFLLVLILACNLASSYKGGRNIPGEPVVFRGDRVVKDHSEIIAWLEANNISWIRTNYWIGYRLAFETSEKVKFIVNQEPNQTRISEWPKEVKGKKIEAMPLVMVPAQAKIIRQALGILQYTYDEQVVSGYHIFYNLKVPNEPLKQIPGSDMEVQSALNSEMTKQAIDGDCDTRWGSGAAQRPGMEFAINLKTPKVLKAVAYSLGDWPQDYPRGLQIEFENPNGDRTLYFDSTGWEAVRDFLQMESKMQFYIPKQEVSKIIFTQTKSHPVFDWSIAEIALFE